jgi:transposase InsO family protein
VPDAKAACPLDCVNRPFKAQRPNQLWVGDFTYLSSWQGFVNVAFVVFARHIVGWRVSTSMQPGSCCAAAPSGTTSAQPTSTKPKLPRPPPDSLDACSN